MPSRRDTQGFILKPFLVAARIYKAQCTTDYCSVKQGMTGEGEPLGTVATWLLLQEVIFAKFAELMVPVAFF